MVMRMMMVSQISWICVLTLKTLNKSMELDAHGINMIGMLMG